VTGSIDPYAVLGVPRTATRAEIARAYRALARQHHPDAGAAPSPQMARINEAWFVLRDASRRAKWDRLHTVVEPAPWRPAQPQAPRRPQQPDAPPSRMDSGVTVAAIVIGVTLVVAAIMVGIVAASGPQNTSSSFESGEISFDHPSDWTVAEGQSGQDESHRVLAHIVTFPVTDDELCLSFADTCPFTGEAVPAGGASIVITEWREGTPRISDAEDIDAGDIGGAPAAFRIERASRRDFTAWWQLSPPGFPDRWIEVRADIAGLQRERQNLFEELVVMLDTLTFEQDSP
jgi:DnaJ domain